MAWYMVAYHYSHITSQPYSSHSLLSFTIHHTHVAKTNEVQYNNTVITPASFMLSC